MYRFSSICGKLSTAGKWPKIGMHYFVESYKKILKRGMILEASITTEGCPSIAMLGENGGLWPPGFRYTAAGLLPGADLGLFSHTRNLSSTEQSSSLGVQV